MGLVVGVTMVRDEADVLGSTLTHMLSQVDHVIVADNLSGDGTRRIIEDFIGCGAPVTLVEDDEPGYYQAEKMTRLALRAGELGAEWVVPFDADEFWYSPFGRIADVLAGIAPQWLTASAALYDHVATAGDSSDPDPFRRIGWRRRIPAPLKKVACRWRADLRIHQGNHGATYDGGTTDWPGQLVVRHFPWRSAEQFVRKARNGSAAYAAAPELPEDAGAHWRAYGRILEEHGEEALADVFRQWFWEPYPKHRDDLIYDPVAWYAP